MDHMSITIFVAIRLAMLPNAASVAGAGAPYEEGKCHG